MQNEELFNQQEEQLVYLSASIASGCQPCTKYHIRKSLEAGLTDMEIINALAQAISIRDDATRYMELFAQKQKAEDNMGDDNQENITKNEILVGIAAAYSVNFPSALEKYMNLGRNNGISDEELREIINLSKPVIDKARAHADMVADKIGIARQEKNNNENDCCRSCC